MKLRIAGKASKVFRLIGLMDKEQQTQEQQPFRPKTQEDILTGFMERQLFAYLPEWMVQGIRLRSLAEHLTGNLLTVYQVSKK